MKQIFLKYCLISSMCLLTIACKSSEEDLPPSDNLLLNKIEIKESYADSKQKTKEMVTKMYQKIVTTPTRSTIDSVTASEFIQYLISIPKHQIDSLYSTNCTPQWQNQRDEAVQTLWQLMSEITSKEEVSNLMEFINDYEDPQNRSFEFIFNSVINQSPIIQACIINSAAIIDEIMSNDSQTRSVNRYCLKQLERSLCEEMIEGAASEIVLEMAESIPYVGIIAALADAGYNGYNTIKLAYDYDQCTVSHWE